MAGALTALSERVPASAHISIWGSWATPELPDAERIQGAWDALRVLAAASGRYPGEHLLLLDGRARLPPLACERLLRALEEPGILGAFPLDDGPRSPLPANLRTTDDSRMDIFCFAYSERCILDDSFFPGMMGALSAWHGEHLQHLGSEHVGNRDAIDEAGLRVVTLDHVYVPNPTFADFDPCRLEEPRDPSPALLLASLRARLGEAWHKSGTPQQPGLDAKPVILHIQHGWGGGAERWIRDFAGASTAHHLTLVARGSPYHRRHGEMLELRDESIPEAPLRSWSLPRPIADTALADAAYRAILDSIIHNYCITAITISSLIGHSLDVLRTGLPTFHVIHDHYPLWPVLHKDFGDPLLNFDAAQLTADLAASGSSTEFENRDPQHWLRLRGATVAALTNARAMLIAPSRTALANHLRLAPELSVLPSAVIPHGLAPWPPAAPTPFPPPPRKRLRLVVVGRIRRGKGADLLSAALPRLRAYAEIFLLGAGNDAQDLFGEHDVNIVLDYRRDELPGLLATLRPDGALLLPTVSETFSYTLSELLSLGVPVIATRVGALAERIQDGVDGLLIDPDPDAVTARIALLQRDRSILETVRTTLLARKSISLAEMAESYNRVMQLDIADALRYPLLNAQPDFYVTAVIASSLERCRSAGSGLRDAYEAACREVERRGQWGHELNRSLDRTGKRLVALQSEYDVEMANARRKIASLQAELSSEIAEANTRLELMQKSYEEHLEVARKKLSSLHAELDDRTAWALRIDAELQELKPRYEQILASWSWRMTQPLRSLNARLRNVRVQLAFRAGRVRTLGGRLRGSLARRGLLGTLARIAEERHRAAPEQGRLPHREPLEDDQQLVIGTSATPRVSIVVPVYNKIAYTLACLHSLAEHAGPTPFEVIVVDDGSTDATPERLAGVDGLRLVRNARNLGFVGSCNAGAAVARGEFLLFLNNDTVVTAGWLEALLRCAEEAPDAGLVGARLVYPDGRLQEAGGIIFNDGSGWNYGRFGDPADSRYAFRREVDYCSGAAILLRRALFEQLGAFDARYAPAYYEDTDLAFAVREAGLKVYYEPAATVIHFEGITSGTDTGSGTKRYQVVNQAKFLEKWKEALARQPAPGTPITIAATHRAGQRVLVVDATTPTPDQDSGSVRIVNLMRVLGDLGCQVSFLPENRAWVERYTQALQEIGIEALYAPYAQDPVRLLRERGREFDLVILSRHYVAASFIGLLRLHAPQARLAFDTVDLHYLREQRAAELAGSAELARVAANTRAQELKVIRDCDVTLVVSPVEQALLATDAPGARVEVLSNVHEVHGRKAGFAERRGLVFVGGFQHPPNIDAVEWFVAEVFPRIRAELPDIEFHVIGSKAPEAIRALGGNGVIVHGFVPDILPYMDGCRVSVAPLRYGAGVKGKVNMAMSCGLPVVATPIAVEGMHVEAGREVLVAADAAGFAAEVVRLYGNEALWNSLSEQGLANVEQHFSFAAARRALAGLLDGAGATRRA